MQNSMTVLAMLGSAEIIGILIICLLLFGAKKIPELMKGLGTGIKEFKKASREVQEEINHAVESEPPPPPKKTAPQPSSNPPPTA
ncbi:Sec-independent protein translocase subunit TatA/TatB [Fontisphaera persica]|uniref:Sec-independent protein translocase subunit TatA/TatB n=1 Tax=Fontisphaera persica TaxID=2974023 RepID=UPI003CCE3249